MHGEFVDLIPLSIEHAEITLKWRKSNRASLLNRGSNTLNEQIKWISTRPSNEYNFIISLKKNNINVGMVSITGIDLINRHCEPSRFLIGEEKSVQGIPVAVESMKLIYYLAFDILNLERVYGYVAESNINMIKWQKFLGMQEEGRWRKHLFINNSYQDAVLLGMLKAEYKINALPKMNALISVGRTM